MKANYKVSHAMLLFGLTVEGMQILDRYLSRGFVREEVKADVNLRSGSIAFSVRHTSGLKLGRVPRTRRPGSIRI